jgi:hypothetical protein
MNFSTLWRAGLLQAVLAIILFSILGLFLDKDFFESWGWLVGPAGWLGCAAIVARVVKLPMDGVLIGATLSGLLSVPFVFVHLHPVGMLVAMIAFALWCGRLRIDHGLPAETI